MHHDEVNVSVTIKISRDNDLRHPAIRGEAIAIGERLKGAIQVVVKQLKRRIGIDKEQVEIAVVIGIKKEAVSRISTPTIDTSRLCYVMPTAVWELTP
jgi:hypothetical protein